MKKCLLALATILLISLSLPCHAKNNSTQYPIVLVHGLLGFDSLLGVDYFHNIPSTLSLDGHQVFVAAVSAVHSSEFRGQQLLAQVNHILTLTGAEKVNLIGHSQGAQTVRYVASISPNLVASVTSIGGANYGSTLADLIREEIKPNSPSEHSFKLVFAALGSMISLLSGHSDLPQDPLAALYSLTSQGASVFNQKYPEGLPPTACEQGQMLASNGVYYFSWSGTAALTNILDPTDLSMLLGSILIVGQDDGLISRCSSHLGHVIKDDYKMNHLDEINQFIGLHHLREVDPVELYRQHVKRLQELGL